jgi:Ribosomal RNA adenine dimethylase
MGRPLHRHAGVRLVGTFQESGGHRYLNGHVLDDHHRMILDSVLAQFRVTAGDRVIEIGAGSGRYTEALLARGLRITVVEPDLDLLERLRRRLGHRSELTVRDGTIADCDAFEVAHLVCGFHVLHHLSSRELGALSSKLDASARGVRQDFKGWFFLEPNPVSPLYPIQIALTRAMRWREERGIWTNNYAVLSRDRNQVPRLGDVGLFPPRPWVARLPGVLRRSGAALSRHRSPVHCYTVYGEVFSRG